MSDAIRKAGFIWLALVFFTTHPLRGAQFADSVNLSSAKMVSSGKLELNAENSILKIKITPDNPETEVRIPLTQPLDSRGKSRLLLTMRSITKGMDGLCLSRIHLEGENWERATFEPDLGISFHWGMRTALFSKFKGKIPEKVTAVLLHFWVPHEIGRDFTACIKNIELLNDDDIAKRVAPPAGKAPKKISAVKSEIKPEDQRWTSIDFGGGGWYRCVRVSPHDGTCFLGSDVGGIYVSRDNCESWELCSADLPNLYIQDFAFHPKDPNLVIAVTKGGPVRSTDNGRTWAIMRRGLPQCQTWGMSAPMLSIAFHPTNEDLVLAGGGFDKSGYSGSIPKKDRHGAKWKRGVIYRSVDRGESWETYSLPGEGEMDNYSVTSFLFSPTNPDKIYAATNGGGLICSSDAGKSWEKYGADLSKYVLGYISASPAEPDTWLLSYSGGADKRGGVLLSRDKGQTWKEVNRGLPAKVAAWRLIADAEDPKTFYVGWFRGVGLFVTHNQGQTWNVLCTYERLITKPYFSPQMSATGMTQDANNPDRLLICNAMHVYQTLDAGQSWEVVSSKRVEAATADKPALWRGRNCPVLCAGGPQTIAVDPSNPQHLYFGYMDDHSWKSIDGGETFSRLTNGTNNGFGRTGAFVLDPADSRIVYMTQGRNYGKQQLYKSVDSGMSFYLLGHEDNGLPPGAAFNLLIDPSSPIEKRVIYALVTTRNKNASFQPGVYRSDDGGFTWQPKNSGLPQGRSRFGQIAMDPRNPKRLFMVCNNIRPAGYIARSEDGGENWTVLKEKIEPQCVLIDPFDSNKIYVGNRNFSGNDYPNAFYRSLDGGDTWESTGQESFPYRFMKEMPLSSGQRTYLNCLAADPTTPGRIYAGCTGQGYDINNTGGVFVSDDWGKTWRQFPTEGLANYGIGTLIVDPTNPSRLYVGTGGNSFFRYGPAPKQEIGYRQ